MSTEGMAARVTGSGRTVDPLPCADDEFPNTDTPELARATQPNLNRGRVPLRLWPAILLTGAGAGLTAGLLMKVLRAVQHLSFHYSQGNFLSGVEAASGERRVLVLACAGLLAGIVLPLVRRLPDHDGPGVNEAIWKHCGELPGRSMAVKAILSIIVVAMGAALGREAALKQFGGLVGLKLGDFVRLRPEERKLLVACGVGAGMAAAYNVPLGGALFTLEVLLGTMSMAAALPAFAASFLASWVAWLMLPNEPTYKMPYLAASRPLFVWAILSGPILGLASVLFVRGIRWAKEHKPKGWAVAGLPIIVCILLGVAATRAPALLGNGKNVVQLALEARVTGILLLLMVVVRPIGTMGFLRAGVPGGLFTPAITFGAVAGVALGQAWAYVAPGSDHRAFALIGSAAVLAAASQAPISSVVFILELTYNSSNLIVPILLAVCGSVWTYQQFEADTYF